MIRLARRIDPEARAIRRKYEDTVAAVVAKNHGGDREGPLRAVRHRRLPRRDVFPPPVVRHRARVERGGAHGGSLDDDRRDVRSGYGARAFRAARAPGCSARGRLDLATPLNFTTDNDIVGGNSGLPLLNRDARLVGLVFDGNIHSLAGDYWFDERVNRTVALTGAAILEALEKVYGARRLAAELRGGSKR